ncbi:MAG: HYR domain-containing protein [Gemmatimonadaceae bacterium]
MLRPTAASPIFSLLKMASAGAIVLVVGLSCSDTRSPTAGTDAIVRVSVNTIDIVDPDSVKDGSAVALGETRIVPVGPLSNVLSSPVFPAADVAVAPSCGGGGEFPGYIKSKRSYAIEALPKFAPVTMPKDDGILSDVDLGFDFNFQGTNYHSVNVYMNGFVLFGTLPSLTNGFSSAGSIASTLAPNNVIALSWMDWSPQLATDGIRWETRGDAPNRRFVLQYNDVPEFASASKPGAISPTVGRLTSQLVLWEGSNEITIYTSNQTVKNTSHFVTQGIENGSGTKANYDSVFNVNTGLWSKRVRNVFQLQDDFVRFSPISAKDEVAPLFTATPENVTHDNDPGLGSAVVAVAPPGATDNCSNVTVTGVRGDGKALDAPYPVGVTTITWTATDAALNSASVTQTVTVIDIEDPVWASSVQSLIEVNATSLNGAVVTFNDLVVTDNVAVTERSCVPASGGVFHVGYTAVTCTAWDAAHNSAATSFQVYVIGAHEQIGALMDEIKNELEVPNGTLQPLLNQLKLAFSQTADGQAACKKVSDFISMVQKKSSNLSPEDAAALTAEATRIMNVMGCSVAAPTAKPYVSFQQVSNQ